ncbi:MAG: BtrH N-terminal domain-containing protein, partial [Anaerolineae bacterium]|nr:BtrH N-terminal domain-containing protein [Anaerolineae bacterium]
MPLQPFPGFRHVETHHCITGSLRHIYLHNEHDLSEELLLGIGNGVGFVYWQQKGAQPFIGGRYMDRKRGYEVITGERTGVGVTMHTTSSARKAEQSLLARLERGEPVMLQVDMGYLPYFDFGGEEYHFGYHVIVACGYDPATRTVLIADRDADLHPVPLEALAAARGSTYKPFPPQ